MEQIKNIYCIGRNYVEHVKELNNQMPKYPVVFNKPTHSLIQANGKEIAIPGHRGNVHYEVEIVLHLKEDYDENKQLNELIQQMYIGLDLTLRDIQDELKEKQYPWLIAKGFKNSAILSQPISFPGIKKLKETPFSLTINGETVQKGKAKQMIFDIDTQLRYINENLSLKKGDIIFTGTPPGVNALKDGDQLFIYFGSKQVGSCSIKFI